ncbi:MFS transporter, partial [Francisella tularensis subsp. holarctica]|nr:MFS transporter [Francisella tularensis subsp. holarctica]
VYEQPAKSRSFYTSVVILCATLGLMLASIVYYLLSLVITTEQIFAFSWRLAFAFGGIAILVSYICRASIQETLVTESTVKRG